MTSGRITRVLIVDDHPMMCEGLAARIGTQAGIEICGEAASVREALAKVKATSPDLLLVDIMLAGSHGIDLIKQVHSDFPSIKMLVISAYDELLYAERALRAGAHGYINKCECQVKIIDALNTVLDGQRYISPQIAQRLVNQAIGGNALPITYSVERLSDRELEVFELIGQGETTGAIAKRLYLSVHTIETHREKIRYKLGLKTGTELMRSAVQHVLEQHTD